MTMSTCLVVLVRSAAIIVALIVLTRSSQANVFGAYIDVSAGTNHSCAVLANGRVECWGGNAFGQLGNNATVSSSVPVLVQGISGAVQVSVGANFSCATLADRTVWCWGTNSVGQLGNGSVGGSALVPVQTLGISTAKAVSAGSTNACALVGVAGGTGVMCWGFNSSGQVGDGTTNAAPAPVLLNTPNTMVAVSVGGNHSCAITATGALLCWGLGAQGQLGVNSTATSLVPIPVTTIASVFIIEAGAAHTCARLTTPFVHCWGSNSVGQLGDETLVQRLVPVPSTGGVSKLAVGGNTTCVIATSDSSVACWGNGTNGQLGNGVDANAPTLQATKFISTAVQISVGVGHACARLADGSLRCWGRNFDGQLGDGTLISSNVPVATLGGPCNLDIDGDGIVGSTTDTLLLARAVAGQGSATLTNTILAPKAMRRNGSAVRSYLSTVCNMTGLAP
jgi:alpha-tubulin suppressor-like RCC1 family protein